MFKRIRRAFGPRPRASCNPPAELLLRLQVHLSETCGGSVMGCGCGGYITPIVNRYPTHNAIVGLGCLSCHAVMPLEEIGILDRAPESVEADAPSAGLRLH